jgi:hypothetical protein
VLDSSEHPIHGQVSKVGGGASQEGPLGAHCLNEYVTLPAASCAVSSLVYLLHHCRIHCASFKA